MLCARACHALSSGQPVLLVDFGQLVVEFLVLPPGILLAPAEEMIV